jgi:hypothetical protein
VSPHMSDFTKERDHSLEKVHLCRSVHVLMATVYGSSTFEANRVVSSISPPRQRAPDPRQPSFNIITARYLTARLFMRMRTTLFVPLLQFSLHSVVIPIY